LSLKKRTSRSACHLEAITQKTHLGVFLLSGSKSTESGRPRTRVTCGPQKLLPPFGRQPGEFRSGDLNWVRTRPWTLGISTSLCLLFLPSRGGGLATLEKTAKFSARRQFEWLGGSVTRFAVCRPLLWQGLHESINRSPKTRENAGGKNSYKGPRRGPPGRTKGYSVWPGFLAMIICFAANCSQRKAFHPKARGNGLDRRGSFPIVPVVFAAASFFHLQVVITGFDSGHRPSGKKMRG